MTAIFSSAYLSARKRAAFLPWLGSVKQTWKTQSLPLVTSSEDADGVIMKVRSSLQEAATETEGPVSVGPTRACIPQSTSVL